MEILDFKGKARTLEAIHLSRKKEKLQMGTKIFTLEMFWQRPGVRRSEMARELNVQSSNQQSE